MGRAAGMHTAAVAACGRLEQQQRRQEQQQQRRQEQRRQRRQELQQGQQAEQQLREAQGSDGVGLGGHAGVECTYTAERRQRRETTECTHTAEARQEETTGRTYTAKQLRQSAVDNAFVQGKRKRRRNTEAPVSASSLSPPSSSLPVAVDGGSASSTRKRKKLQHVGEGRRRRSAGEAGGTGPAATATGATTTSSAAAAASTRRLTATAASARRLTATAASAQTTTARAAATAAPSTGAAARTAAEEEEEGRRRTVGEKGGMAASPRLRGSPGKQEPCCEARRKATAAGLAVSSSISAEGRNCEAFAERHSRRNSSASLSETAAACASSSSYVSRPASAAWAPPRSMRFTVAKLSRDKQDERRSFPTGSNSSSPAAACSAAAADVAAAGVFSACAAGGAAAPRCSPSAASASPLPPSSLRRLRLKSQEPRMQSSPVCDGSAATPAARLPFFSSATAAAAARNPCVNGAAAAPTAAPAGRRGCSSDDFRREEEEEKKKKQRQRQQRQQRPKHPRKKVASSSFSCTSSAPPSSSSSSSDEDESAATGAAAAAAPVAARSEDRAAPGVAAAAAPAAATASLDPLFSCHAYEAMAGTQLLHPRLVRTLQHHHLQRPTLIQQLAIPTVLHGHDVFIQCFTGSGKTLCFAVPLLQQLLVQHERSGKQLRRSDGTRCILLLPTRELAAQVCVQISKIAQLFPWIVVSSITGGEKKQSEKRRLRGGVTVLLCTPGRLLDHLATTSSFHVPFLHLLVLDEADRLLDLGFEKKIKCIFMQLKEKKEEQLRLRLVLTQRDAEAGLCDSASGKLYREPASSSPHHVDFSEYKQIARKGQTEEEQDDNAHEEEDEEEERRGAGRGETGKRFPRENGEKNDVGEEFLTIRRPEEGFQVVMVSATLTPQVKRLAAFCLHQQPQWVSLERYRYHLERRAAVAHAVTTPCDAERKNQQQLRHQEQQGRRRAGALPEEEDDACGFEEEIAKADSELFPCCCTLDLADQGQLSAAAAGAAGSSAGGGDTRDGDNEEGREPGDGGGGEEEGWCAGGLKKGEVFCVPEQLRQFYVVVDPRMRVLPLLSFLLQIEAAKGKALVFASCCDAVDHLHEFCSQLRWPPPVASHRRRDQQQLLLLQQQRRKLQEQHGQKLQHVLSSIEALRRQRAKRVKKLEQRASFGAAADADEDAREDQQCAAAAAARNGRRRDSGQETPQRRRQGDASFVQEDQEDEEVMRDTDDEEEDEEEALWGDHVFKNLQFFKLHGKMTRDDRIGYLKEFVDADSAAVAFATDVAARGLNLPHVSWVVQYDLPQQLEEYVHRIGRTARLGQQGNALLFLLSCEAGYAEYLQERGLRLQDRLEEEKMIETLCSSHMPAYLRHITLPSRFLLKQFAGFVATRPSLLHAARKAFLGTLRSLRALSKEVKSVCDHSALHTGHFASSFGLNEGAAAAAQHLRAGSPGGAAAPASAVSSSFLSSSSSLSKNFFQNKKEARQGSAPVQRYNARPQKHRERSSKDASHHSRRLFENSAVRERDTGRGLAALPHRRHHAGGPKNSAKRGFSKETHRQKKPPSSRSAASSAVGPSKEEQGNSKEQRTVQDIAREAAQRLRSKGDVLPGGAAKCKQQKRKT